MEIYLNPDEVEEKKSKVVSAPELHVALDCIVRFTPLCCRLLCMAGLLWILVHKAIFCAF